MQIYDIAGYHIRGLLKSLQSLGIDVQALLRDASVDLRTINDPEARFPEPLAIQLWLEAERCYAGELFGVKAALGIPFGSLELIDYLVAASPTAGEAIQTLAHHGRLCASGFTHRIEPATFDGEEAFRFEYEHRLGMALMPRSMIEYLWTLLISRLRDHGNGAFRPALRLQYAPQGPERAYRHALGNVTFHCERDELYISRSQWELANARRDPTLATLLSCHARDVYQRMPASGDFFVGVDNAIADGLRAGDPSIERTAAQLGITPRTLQRRLTESGKVYKELLDAMRRELAERYLLATKLPLTEIGYLLAYSEPSAFNRAFRRWNGMTPAEFRRLRSALGHQAQLGMPPSSLAE